MVKPADTSPFSKAQMINGLFYAHSGLRHLVLLVGVVALLFFAFGWMSGRAAGRADRTLMAVFAGLLGLQGVLGIVLVGSGIYYPRLMGHLALMIVAIATAHIAAAMARRAADPRRAHLTRLLGVALTLVLIIAGIQAIGRGVFESAAPSIGR